MNILNNEEALHFQFFHFVRSTLKYYKIFSSRLLVIIHLMVKYKKLVRSMSKCNLIFIILYTNINFMLHIGDTLHFKKQGCCFAIQ